MKLFGINLALGKGRGTLPSFSRNEYIAASFGLIILFAIGLVAYDAYLFYQDVLERSIGTAPQTSKLKFSESTIDEVITLLDEREKKFNEILNGN